MAKPGLRKIYRYSDEFKATAARLDSGVEVVPGARYESTHQSCERLVGALALVAESAIRHRYRLA